MGVVATLPMETLGICFLFYCTCDSDCGENMNNSAVVSLNHRVAFGAMASTSVVAFVVNNRH